MDFVMTRRTPHTNRPWQSNTDLFIHGDIGRTRDYPAFRTRRDDAVSAGKHGKWTQAIQCRDQDRIRSRRKAIRVCSVFQPFDELWNQEDYLWILLRGLLHAVVVRLLDSLAKPSRSLLNDDVIGRLIHRVVECTAAPGISSAMAPL